MSMGNSFEPNSEWRGLDFWNKELEKAGKLSSLSFFNDVIIENRAPHPESGYGRPVLTDIILDGRKSDVYHSDSQERQTYHRLFIHIKE